MSERVLLAAHSSTTVVAASGLLAAFNDDGVLEPLDVAAAGTIGRLCGESDESVLLAAALTVRSTRFGHVCVRLGELREAVVVDHQDPAITDALPWPEPRSWEAAVASSVLVGDATGSHPLVLVDDRLYLERYFRFEQKVARILSKRALASMSDVAPAVRSELERLLTADGESNSQLEAALCGLGGNLAVIAGGPGTGKTHAIGAMLVALASADPGAFPRVAVCAPTGKAAARLGEALSAQAEASGDPAVVDTVAGVQPSTIHRLLGWSWGRSRFARDENNRLPHDLVIVDEMSMVSLPLAARLLQAVRDDATVVLVGDPYQLESIEAGTVLADIVGAGMAGDSPVRDRVVVLDRAFRFEADSVTASFAGAVREGDDSRALELLGSGDPRLRWVPDRAHPGFDELWRTIVEHRSGLVERARSGELEASMEALSELAVLCAHRRGPSGVSEWGKRIETALDERYPGLRWQGEWYPGRPVMITRNDYNLDLYNGDVGIVVGDGDALVAVFDRNGPTRFALSHLTEHTTVHAMTIHKSQGSQFDQVVVVLPDSESRLLTRELLYTAVTRARSRVWVMGREEVIRQAVSRSVQRASGLADRLWD